MTSQAELISKGYLPWFLVLSQFFRDGMGPFKLTLYFIYIFRYFDDTLLGLFDNRAASYIAATELGRPIVWTHLRNDWDDSPLGL